MKRWMILGGSGNLGQAFQDVLRTRHVELLAPTHRELDVLDANALTECIRSFHPAVLLNSVCLMGIEPNEMDPVQAYRLNAHLPLLLARLCRDAGCVLLQPSTHAVFDGTKSEPYLESGLPSPTTVYGGTKLLGESFVLATCPCSYVFRLPTLFGPRTSGTPGFVEKMLDRIRRGQSVRIASDKLDTPTYSLDAAERVVDLVLEEAEPGLYHLANAGYTSYFEFIHAAARLLGRADLVIPGRDRDFPALYPKPLRTGLASEKIEPMRPWSEALKHFLGTEVQ